MIVGGTRVDFFYKNCDASILAIIPEEEISQIWRQESRKLKNPAIHINFLATKWTYCLNMAISEKKIPSKSGNFGAILFTTKYYT